MIRIISTEMIIISKPATSPPTIPPIWPPDTIITMIIIIMHDRVNFVQLWHAEAVFHRIQYSYAEAVFNRTQNISRTMACSYYYIHEDPEDGFEEWLPYTSA